MVLQFWELDSDHDFLISREDLMRYSTHSLTYRVVDRIFNQVDQTIRLSPAGCAHHNDELSKPLCMYDQHRTDSKEQLNLTAFGSPVALLQHLSGGKHATGYIKCFS